MTYTGKEGVKRINRYYEIQKEKEKQKKRLAKFEKKEKKRIEEKELKEKIKRRFAKPDFSPLGKVSFRQKKPEKFDREKFRKTVHSLWE